MKNSWISVKDSLPENENDVLIYTSDGRFDIAYYSKSCRKWLTYGYDVWYINVTHWQPFQKPTSN